MEYNGGSYDQDSYGSDGSERNADGYGRSGSDAYDGSRNPYGQSSSYGRDMYGGDAGRRSGRGAQGGYGDADDEQTRTEVGYGYGAQGGYGGGYAGQDGYERTDDYDAQGRYDRAGGYNAPQGGYDRRGDSGRYQRPDDYGRDAYSAQGGYDRANDYNAQGGYDRREDSGRYRRPDDYAKDTRGAQAGGYERANDYDPQGGYDRRGDSGRYQRPDDYGYAGDAPRRVSGDDGRRQGDNGGDDYEAPPRPARKKKKRSKAARFISGLGKYIAQLPAKTLVIFGGVVAVILVGVILLVILLPKGAGTETDQTGQLSIADVMTPTPSLAPTNTPEVTPEPEVTAAPNPLEGIVIKTVGETNDAIPAVQERLVELGYMEMPEGGYTNKYGPSTKTSIRLFQMKNYDDSKQWDGQLGPGTYSLLMGADAKSYYLSRGDGDDRTSVITKLVEDVSKLQNRLIALGYLAAGSSTGLYGDSTAAAVQTFQQYHGLKADGKAGQATLSIIYTDQAMDAATGKINDKSKLSPSPDPAGTVTGTATADPAAATDTGTATDAGTATAAPTA